MEVDEYIDVLVAQRMYEEEIAKKLGIDFQSEYGRKKLNEFLEEERKNDVQKAILYLKKKFPGKFIRKSEIIIEAERIKNERLEPYLKKTKAEQNLENEKMLQEQNNSVLTKKCRK